MTIKLKPVLCLCIVFAWVGVSADDEFPLPFAGSFQSLGSEAHELTSGTGNSWKAIPQNVYLRLVKDLDILEIRLTIDVLDDDGGTLYPIHNAMWLRHVGNGELEVFKFDNPSGTFTRVGNGSCSRLSCSYEYVIWVENNGNPYEQRYTSKFTWTQDQAGKGFFQSGSLSAKQKDAAVGEDPWLVFKTWSNQFKTKP